MSCLSVLKRAALALVALLAQPALAQQAVAPVSAARPALWKVADADTTIYLFGTIHLLPEGMLWFDGQLASAFEQSGELVTEIPEIADNETSTAAFRYGTLPPGQSLRALLGKQEKSKFAQAMKQLGLPEAAFDRFRPWYAAVLFATLPLQRSGYDLQHGVEATLAARNKALGHSRTGLETLDYQLGLFAAFPLKVQKRYLFDVIGAMPTIDKDIGAMVAAWGKGDAISLAAQLNEEEDDPAMVKTLLTDRNRNWAAWIKTRLARPGTVFVAVGAGHLGGKGSVQDQLAAAGVATIRVQ